jgi:hypothetical protein
VSPADQPEILAVLRETYEIGEDLEPRQVFDSRPLQEAAQTVDASGWRPR